MTAAHAMVTTDSDSLLYTLLIHSSVVHWLFDCKHLQHQPSSIQSIKTAFRHFFFWYLCALDVGYFTFFQRVIFDAAQHVKSMGNVIDTCCIQECYMTKGHIGCIASRHIFLNEWLSHRRYARRYSAQYQSSLFLHQFSIIPPLKKDDAPVSVWCRFMQDTCS